MGKLTAKVLVHKGRSEVVFSIDGKEVAKQPVTNIMPIPSTGEFEVTMICSLTDGLIVNFNEV